MLTQDRDNKKFGSWILSDPSDSDVFHKSQIILLACILLGGSINDLFIWKGSRKNEHLMFK